MADLKSRSERSWAFRWPTSRGKWRCHDVLRRTHLIRRQRCRSSPPMHIQPFPGTLPLIRPRSKCLCSLCSGFSGDAGPKSRLLPIIDGSAATVSSVTCLPLIAIVPCHLLENSVRRPPSGNERKFRCAGDRAEPDAKGYTGQGN